jgi:hypothetical protein
MARSFNLDQTAPFELAALAAELDLQGPPALGHGRRTLRCSLVSLIASLRRRRNSPRSMIAVMAERLKVIRVGIGKHGHEIEPDHLMIIRIAAEAAGELFPRHSSFIVSSSRTRIAATSPSTKFQPEEHRRGRMRRSTVGVSHHLIEAVLGQEPDHAVLESAAVGHER